ncbi:dihydroorotate dehydrogenase (quinone) [Alloscardovia macacae]|uniref:Dihydroorotate dehydrogenase (quinone) n=1 Tax=Alloscardovia macacae TaxID=1160091 RepID=A0A1Y2SZW8_9BIFI|nr:quinone-dependent dihydroorotate dehydrogenase [Alloscardovia macacae]OTA26259.1 dihydroorotate dehydrogenase (quinone) [Alloscardovia macacae]OTA28920.1 dihydroorotate dehydrogenase (quinone) [Alloscardovia macacae]
MGYVSENIIRDTVNRASTGLFQLAYKEAVKPIVFDQSPDEAHDQMIQFARVTRNIPPLMWALRAMIDYTDPILETQALGLTFANPFGLSAGLDKNCDLPVLLENAGFGFETIGSITSRPCAGNPRPWFHRLPEYASMMVHVGLANEGIGVVMPRVEKAYLNSSTMRISASIARTNDALVGDIDEGVEDYAKSFRRAADHTHMLEINISCPNTTVGEQFTKPENLDKLFTKLDTIERTQPVLVKMPSDKSWEEFKELLDVLAAHNVQGVSIANLRKDREGLDVPEDWVGGLSGLPTVDLNNSFIEKTYREYHDRFEIAGIGGVFTPEQAYAKIRKGSSLVMFITSLMYRGPQNITVLKRGLASLLRRDGFSSVAEAVGVDVE